MFSVVITPVVVVVVVLGTMILVHEMGHFVAAKLCGVRVVIFSLGFGKRLLGFKSGDTDYRLSVLPIGGYVKMAGDDPRELHGGDPGEFLSRPRWQRFFVVIMGPTMNVAMAVWLLAGLYHYHYVLPAYLRQPARIGDLDAGSPAEKAGLLRGDTIVRLGNLTNPTWEDAETKVSTTVDEQMPLDVLRQGSVLHFTLVPKAQGPSRLGTAGWYPYAPGVIERVEAGLPAARAGVKPGDQIVGVDGRETFFWLQIASSLQASHGKELELKILRDGKTLEVHVTPVFSKLMGETKWRIGVEFRNDMVVQNLSWIRAIQASVTDNLKYVLATADVLEKVITRRLSARILSGPIGIVQMSSEAYRAGFSELVVVVSFISLQLAIFNLLPIPILDGGVILLLIIEGLMGRDLSLEFKERVVQVGLVLLLLLAVVVMYQDIVKNLRPS